MSPASCGIASLARQGLITPNPATACAARDDGHQSFLEGTVLNSAHKHVTPLGEHHLAFPTWGHYSHCTIAQLQNCHVNPTYVFVSIIASAYFLQLQYGSDCDSPIPSNKLYNNSEAILKFFWRMPISVCDWDQTKRQQDITFFQRPRPAGVPNFPSATLFTPVSFSFIVRCPVTTHSPPKT